MLYGCMTVARRKHSTSLDSLSKSLMDLMDSTTSMEDLVAMAEAQGIHVEEQAEKEDVIELIRASLAADSELSPPPRSTVSATAVVASIDEDEVENDGDKDDEVAAASASASADMFRSVTEVKDAATEGMSPPRRGSPVSMSWQQLSSLPEAPRLSDILAARGMARARVDTSSSVAAEAGTDAGSIAGGFGGVGGSEGVFDPDADTEPGGEGDGEEATSSAAGQSHATSSDEEKREAVDTFMGITQVVSSKAVQFLEATEWNVGAAINLFMESGGDSGATPASRDQVTRPSRSGDNDNSSAWRYSARMHGVSRSAGRGNGDGEDDNAINVDAEMANFGSVSSLGGLSVPRSESAGASGVARSLGSSSPASGSVEEDHDVYPGGFSEDGVRAPIPNRRDRLIDGVVDHPIGPTGAILGDLIRGSLGRAGATPAEEDKTDWIFSIPEGLSFASDFVETRQLCKEQKKWLMINIQDHEEFASHRMNKDVWSNETILTLLRGNFVFWQRNKTLRQARYYIEKYNLDGEVLPHTAILDPRTGTQLLKVVGYVEAQVLSMAIVEFLESNSIDQVKAPKLKTIGRSNMRARQADNPGKEGATSDRTSLENSMGAYGGGGAVGGESIGKDSYHYDSFGSEDYEYDEEPDGDDVRQGASVEGDNNNGTRTPSGSNSSPDHVSLKTQLGSTGVGVGGGGSAAEATSAVTAAGATELAGPWGRGSPEDVEFAMAMEASLKGVDEGDMDAMQVDDDEVPEEPEAGQGVTQMRFRLPSGGGTIARRFWMKDRVSLLFKFVRNTVEEASTRPFDLLSGHPPSSLSERKDFTVEDAELRNSVIMVRWL